MTSNPILAQLHTATDKYITDTWHLDSLKAGQHENVPNTWHQTRCSTAAKWGTVLTHTPGVCLWCVSMPVCDSTNSVQFQDTSSPITLLQCLLSTTVCETHPGERYHTHTHTPTYSYPSCLLTLLVTHGDKENNEHPHLHATLSLHQLNKHWGEIHGYRRHEHS